MLQKDTTERDISSRATVRHAVNLLCVFTESILISLSLLFSLSGTFNPTWCDLCGDLIWGLFDTGASRCQRCGYICHVKCQKKVRLNCSALVGDADNIGGPDEEEEEGPVLNEETLADVSTLKSEIHEKRTSVVVVQGGGSSGSSSEDDDAYQTLKDVDSFQFDQVRNVWTNNTCLK